MFRFTLNIPALDRLVDFLNRFWDSIEGKEQQALDAVQARFDEATARNKASTEKIRSAVGKSQL